MIPRIQWSKVLATVTVLGITWAAGRWGWWIFGVAIAGSLIGLGILEADRQYQKARRRQRIEEILDRRRNF